MPADPPTVLLTGATGFLGSYVAAELRRRGLRLITAARRAADLAFDLASPPAIRAALAAARPDLIVSCGALSSMQACAQSPELAHAVNARAPAVLAESNARLLHISTDLVFDGTAAPYAAAALPRPLSTYGQTKAAGELPVTSSGHLVVRLPLLFGRSHDGRRGATDMIRSARSARSPLTLFTNEYRTPMHAADAAHLLVTLLLDPTRTGLAHLAGPERLSRYALALRFTALTHLPTPLAPDTCNDPTRPRDVSLLPTLPCPRPLDDSLRTC